MDLEFKIGLRPNNIEFINNSSVYVSPEVFEFLKTLNQEPEFVLNNDGKLLKVIRVQDYEKNRIYINGYKDDSSVNISLVDNESITELKSIEFQCQQNQVMLELLKRLAIDFKALPICQDDILNVDGFEFAVKKCLPVQQGLWMTSKTEVKVEFIEKEHKQTLDILKYSWHLTDKSAAYSALFASFKTWLNESFDWSISEIPHHLARKISLQNSVSHAIFVHESLLNHSKDKIGLFSVWPENQRKIQVPIFGSKLLCKKCIFMTPTAAQNFQLEFGSKASCPILTSLSRLKVIKASEVSARLVQENDSTEDFIDHLLKDYFETSKILYFDNTCKTTIEVHHGEKKVYHFDLTLIGNLSTNGGRYYSVGQWTKLLRLEKSGGRIPSMTKLFNGRGQIVEMFPRFIASFAKRIEAVLKGKPNGKVLLHGHLGSGKTDIIIAFSKLTGLQTKRIDCRNLVGDTSGSTETKLRQIFDVSSIQTQVLVLENVQALAKNREGMTDFRVLSCLEECLENSNTKIIGVGDVKSSIDFKLAEMFDIQMEVEPPDSDQERLDILTCLFNQESTVYFELEDIEDLLVSTKGLLYEDLKYLVRQSVWEANDDINVDLIISKACHIDKQHFQKALAQLQAMMGDAIGAPKIPKVQWADVGGLQTAKREILDTIQMPLLNSNLSSLSRSGVLLYGPPGVGKTLLAKAVATELKLNFLSVKGPELLNMYIGQSEENVREVFSRAASAAPAIIFFDELDALAPKRGNAGDSGGVMDRIVSQLLAELDFVSSNSSDKPIFVIGATNRPDLIDSALLRPGRFDRLVFIGPPDDPNEQLKILEALTRKFNLNPGLDLAKDVIQLLPKGLTGADFYAITVDAMMAAVERIVNENLDEEMILEKEDFLKAIEKLKPSVSSEEMIYYRSLQNKIN